MNTMDDFLALLREDMGIPLTAEDTGLPLDEVAGWDSLHLLSLLTLLERRTGRGVPLADVLEAETLKDIYRLTVEA